MINRLHGVALLRGARGNASRDLSALAQLLARISRLPFEFTGLIELDLNPVFLFERGCVAGDARIILASDPTDPTDQRSD